MSDLRRAHLHAAPKEHLREAQSSHSDGHRANHGLRGGVPFICCPELFIIYAFPDRFREYAAPAHMRLLSPGPDPSRSLQAAMPGDARKSPPEDLLEGGCRLKRLPGGFASA